MAETSKIQVSKDHYGYSYIHGPRWHSYLTQIKETAGITPAGGSILVIGLGDGVVPDYLKKQRFRVVTLDIDPELNPDYTGDILSFPVENNSFDAVICAEVLEHLPFSEFQTALNKIHRISKQGAIISVPDARSTLLNLQLKLPFLPMFKLFWKVSNFRKHAFDGQHCWEIGKRGYGLAKVKKEIEKSGFRMVDDFVRHESPAIHFFVLKK